MEEKFEIIVGYRIENRAIISANEYYSDNYYLKQPHVKIFIENMKMQVFNKLEELIYSDKKEVMDKFNVVIQRGLIDDKGKLMSKQIL